MKNKIIEINKPIVFFDLETTGLDMVRDRIIEISLLKLHPNFETEQKTWRINPLIPIPKESSDIHGIKDEHIKNCPVFKDIYHKIEDFISHFDLAGFNVVRFDIPFLAEELLRVGSDMDLKKNRVIDMMNIFHFMEPRNLSAAYKFYCDEEMENAHSAEYDTLATYKVFLGQIQKYKDQDVQIPNFKNKQSFSQLNTLFGITGKDNALDFQRRIIIKDDKPIYNFGKYKGREVEDIFVKDANYHKWILNKDFSEHTKKVLQELYNKWVENKLNNKINN